MFGVPDGCCGPRGNNEDDTDIRGGGKELDPHVDGRNIEKAVRRRSSVTSCSSPAELLAASASDSSKPPKPFGTLHVKVLKGDGLLAMDTRLNLRRMKFELTLDAFVRLSLNAEAPFGTTTVHWRSTGKAEWNEQFSVELLHPRSSLWIHVADDDPIFRKDSFVSFNRECGFIEIPLWELPRNQTVIGCFALNHPDLDHGALTENQTQNMHAHEEDTNSSAKLSQAAAGRIQLELMLETTMFNEFIGYFEHDPPAFESSLPNLDVPGFLEDICEVRRLICQRLILAPIRVILYAISWDNPLISASLLFWNWFLCYHPRFIWATILFVSLLCFWHEIPEQKSAVKIDASQSKPRKSLVTGVLSGAFTMVSCVGTGVRDFAVKPVHGVVSRGLRGLARGVKTGVISTVVNTGRGVYGLGENVVDGVVGTVQTAGQLAQGPGLQEFQQLLQLKPALRDTVRWLQPIANNTANKLQQIDDFFFWADAQATGKAVTGIGASFVFCIIFSDYIKAISGYGYLAISTLVIMANARGFKKAVRAATSAMAVFTRPEVPFKARRWFKALEDFCCYEAVSQVSC